MSALDDIALSDPALKAWMARKKNPRPLVNSLSGIEGFVTAVAAGPRFADPQQWLCPLMGLPADAMVRNLDRNKAVIASVARMYNGVVGILADTPQAFEPRFDRKANGNVEPRPWCQGFYTAMQLNREGWAPIREPGSDYYGLLLPILSYCVDDKGEPVLGKPYPGKRHEDFFEFEAHKDIAPMVAVLRDMHRTTYFD